jgi:hypothetical protein
MQWRVVHSKINVPISEDMTPLWGYSPSCDILFYIAPLGLFVINDDIDGSSARIREGRTLLKFRILNA